MRSPSPQAQWILHLLFLAMASPTTSASVNATVEQRTRFMPEPDGRGTFAVVWSCLFTWFICLWTVVQLNAPAVSDSEMSWYWRKFGCFCLGAVAPELIVTMAYTQWREARQLVDDMNKLQRRSYLPMPQTIDSCQWEGATSTWAKSMRALPLEYWTMIHGFYCAMGGYVITDVDGIISNIEGRTFPVNGRQLVWMIENEFASVPTISADSIKDKSKADSLVKVFAGAQVLWFVAQCLGRWAQSLPTTTLEITTNAFVFCTIPTLFFWWYKPVDIKVPSQLHILRWSDTATESLRRLDPLSRQFLYKDRNEHEYPRVVNTVEIDETHGKDVGYLSRFPNYYPLVGIGALYAMIHCIAWNFSFVTDGERWAWRICALWNIFVSCLTSFRFSFSHVLQRNKLHCVYERIEQVITLLYVIARFYLLVEVLIAFRSMPVGVYKTVDWTIYIPSV